jgi:hypothetical protein
MTSFSYSSAVNCTVPAGARELGFLCCLDAAGTWMDGGWCAFRTPAADRNTAPMQSHLTAWSQCLSRGGWDDRTLARLMADAGQGCFAPPRYVAPPRAWWDSDVVGWLIYILVGILAMGVVIVVCRGAPTCE